MYFFNLYSYVVSTFFTIAFLYKQFKKVTWDMAIHTIVSGALKLLCENNVEAQEFYGTFEFEKDLNEEVSKFDMLDSSYVPWQYDTYSSFGIPSFKKEIVPRNEEDLPKLQAAVSLVCRKHFSQNCTDYKFSIEFEDVSPIFVVRMLYATTPQNIQAFKDYQAQQIENAKEEAIDQLTPPTDKELDDDLDLFGGDSNGGTA